MYDIRSSLSNIMLQKKGICRSQSYENLRGEKGQAAQTASILGKSRKGTPFRLDLQPEEVFTLADIEGKGVIRQFFITVTDQKENGPDVLEKLIVRMYWEREEIPSVECPLGAFFCCGHRKIVMTDMEPWAKGRKHTVGWGSMPVRAMSNHSPIIIVPARSFHCYLPMPFNTHAKITIENCYGAAVSVVAYQVTYTLEQSEWKYAHFHAKYVRCTWKSDMGELFLHKILSQENGTYAGIYLSARQAGKECSINPLLKITASSDLAKSEDIWYEPVSGDDLKNGCWSSFSMEIQIQFKGGLELSLVPFYDTISAETEFDCAVYWYLGI